MKSPEERTLSLTPEPAATEPAARARRFLFVALRTDEPLADVARLPLADADEVVIGRGEAGSRPSISPRGGARAVRVPDRRMSSVHARLSFPMGRARLVDAGSKNGTLLGGAPIDDVVLADGDVIEMGHTFLVYREVRAEAEDAGVAVIAPAGIEDGFATLSPALGGALRRLARVAAAEVPVPVLLRGETGTGKEVAARAVHRLSGRPGGFVAVNCGALPATLLESALFGHRKGAFSGAHEDQPGLVRSADRGTLFLDEIGDLPPPSQTALLRVLQEGEVTPVGASRPVKVDVRVVSATHRDLPAMIARGAFRADLYARLAGHVLVLPPLRERREDLGLLLGALLSRLAPARAARVRLESAAARALLQHDWPLNVRELEKCLGAALALAGDGAIGLQHLPEALREPAAPAPDVEEAPGAPDEEDASPAPGGVEAERRAQLIELLRAHDGNISAVARATGKARNQIQRWIKRYGIDVEGLRRAPWEPPGEGGAGEPRGG